jgi:serine/threonine protein kinase
MENFEILEKLGKGAFSVVYKVRRNIDNQIYALKKVQITNLSEKQKTNSLNEIRVLASIKSKYIVNYKEAFLDTKDSTLCLVMEYADRGDLSKRIEEEKKRNRYFNERDIWRIFIQLVKGLKSLHDLNIIHRDIKSSNIFLFSDGTAKLGDLNVCKILSEDTLGKTQAGTPSFAAPEVWMEKPYGLKSDIWSLGCVLYEITALKCPFRADNIVELNNKILIGSFKRIPKKFSNDLNNMIEHMIRFEPEKRISCKQILECDLVNRFLVNKEGNGDDNCGSDMENSGDDIINSEEKQKLLGTIYMPNNLLYLNNQLPKANYSHEIVFNHKSNINLKPIKIKSDVKSFFQSQNYNKYNSDGKLIHLSNNKRYSQNSKVNNNLSVFFNQDKNKNDTNVNESSKSLKGPIKLIKIKSNLISTNNTNKTKEFTSEKNMNNKIAIKKFSSLNLDEIKKKEKNELQSMQASEKEIKNHHFLDNEKLKEILYNKKRRKSHGHKKDLKFILKARHEKDNVEKKNINNQYNISNNNEYKQVSTDVNILEEDNNKNNKFKLSPIKLNYNLNNNIKYLSNKNVGKYDFILEQNDFRTNIIQKEIKNNNFNNNNNILPVLKSSCKRNCDD